MKTNYNELSVLLDDNNTITEDDLDKLIEDFKSIKKQLKLKSGCKSGLRFTFDTCVVLSNSAGTVVI